MTSNYKISGIKPNPKINSPCHFQILLSMLEFNQKPILPALISFANLYCFRSGALSSEVYEFRALEDTYEQAGVQMTTHPISQSLFSEIRELICENIPIGLVIYKSFMKKFQNENSAERNTYHHLLIYGYNDEKKIFHTIDHNHYNSFVYSYSTVSYSEIKAYLEVFLAHASTEKDRYVHYYYLAPAKKPPLTTEQTRDLYLDDYGKVKDRISDGIDRIGEFAESIHHEDTLPEEQLKGLKRFFKDVLQLNNRKRLELLKFSLLFGEESEIYQIQGAIIKDFVALTGRIGRVIFNGNMKLDENDRIYYYLKKIQEEERNIFNLLCDLREERKGGSAMNSTEKRVCDLFEQEFGLGLQATDNLNEHGVNSIMFTQFMVKLEQAFSTEIPDHLMDVYQLNTLHEVAILMEQMKTAETKEGL